MKEDNTNFEDFEVVKRYFKRIYNLLPKETREKIKNLNLSREEKKKLIKQLGFLKTNKQEDYIKELTFLLKKYER
ncbi:MAG: hypothetical protein P8Y70_02200 [Candidatus Lokiarchaeota archaeon]